MTGVAGTRPLARLAVRRSRVLLVAWIVGLAGTAALSAATTVGIYPTIASRVEAARAANAAPALVALYGRIYDETSLGAIALLKLSGLGAAMVAVLAIVVVVRHTRGDEEAGRLELVGATAVGRAAPLAAAVGVAAGASVALGALAAIGLVLGGLPAAGSIAFGLAWASIGCAFAGVGAVAAQVATGGRAATGLALAVLGATYLLRAAGDAGAPDGLGWLSWLSPIGWGQQVRPFAGDRDAVALLPLLAAVLLVALAFTLLGRRDLGAGLLADRPGPARAGRSLAGVAGLGWREERGLLAGWTGGGAVLGLVMGSAASSVEGMLDSDRVREALRALGGEQVLTDAFLATELGIVGVIAASFGVMAALRLAAEEGAGHAEAVLATGVGRARWVLVHAGLALGGVAVLLVATGLAAGVGHAVATGDAAQVPRLVGAAALQLPPAAVPPAIAVLLYGLAPRHAGVAWGVLAGFVLLGEVGPLLELPRAVLDLSPFAHGPHLPGGDAAPVALLVLAAIAAALIAAGAAAFRRRDVG